MGGFWDNCVTQWCLWQVKPYLYICRILASVQTMFSCGTTVDMNWSRMQELPVSMFYCRCFRFATMSAYVWICQCNNWPAQVLCWDGLRESWMAKYVYCLPRVTVAQFCLHLGMPICIYLLSEATHNASLHLCPSSGTGQLLSH